MCTVAPNNNLGLAEATGMVSNGSDMLMLNDGNVALFLDKEGCCWSMWLGAK